METHPANGPTCIFKVRTCCLGGWGILPLHFTKLWPPKFMKKKKVITCCKRCAQKIKKKLQEIGGVNSITIDYEKGMVAVSGEVDPATLLVAISKLKVTVELVSYKKDPRRVQKNKQAERSKNKHKKDYHKGENQAKNKQKDHHKDKDPKNISHGDEHSNSNSDPYSEENFGEGPNFTAHKNGKPNMKGPLVAPPHGKGYLPNSGSQFQPPMPSGPQHQWGPMMYGRPPLGPPRALPLPPPPMPPPLAYGYNDHLGMVPPPPYGYDYHSSMVLGPRPPPSQIYPYNYNTRPRKTPVGNSMLHYFSDDNTTSSGCTIM